MHGLRPISRARLLLATLTLAACASTRPAPPGSPSSMNGGPTGPARPATAVDLGSLSEGETVDGFVARALYVDDDGRARGARFVHARTRFVLDYVAMETAPQVMFWVNTYPVSDAGEPHTQEHLLLGKGNKGRWLGNVEEASFAETSAFTANYETSYGLTTSAGPDTFFRLLRATFDALLHPDYDDEEIRREVSNFGVTKRPDGTLILDEKGTVYNEMVNTFDSADERVWVTSNRLLYGEGHPLADVAGGTPEGIRGLTPARIRAFHAAHYRLDNMGFVGAFPSSIPLMSALTRTGAILDAFAPSASLTSPFPMTAATLPAPRGAAPGTIRVVDYPQASADHPSPVILAFPATRALPVDERMAMQIFLAAFASGEGSTLYKALIDRTTRELDLGATGVWEDVAWQQGQPIRIGLSDLSPAHADEASMRALRELVKTRLESIAALPDGSKELEAFGARVSARVIELRRWQDKWLDTPPQFASRATGPTWIDELDDMARQPGFRKELTYKGALDRAASLADPSKNAWHDRIRAWGLLDVPYVVAARPSPDARTREDAERDARVVAEQERLLGAYGTRDPQEALRKRDAEISRASEVIAAQEKSVPAAPLAGDPPMTMDDGLNWTTDTRDGVPRFTATFDGMKSATVGLSVSLDAVPDDLLPWVGVLADLVSDVGVIRDGVPLAYDDARDRLRREVLGIQIYPSTNFKTGRARLVFQASGNDAAETRRALAWLRDYLAAPDWRVENLARIRDVLDERLSTFHATLTQREENWVQDTEEALRHQDRVVVLHASAPLVRVHDAFVTSWQLQGGDDARGVAPFLRSLAAAGETLPRKQLAALAEALASNDANGIPDPKIATWARAAHVLPKGAASRVQKAGRDLGQLIADVPDTSLAGDWNRLCEEMAQGVSRPPSEALEQLKRVLTAVRHTSGAQLWEVGSLESQRAVEDDVGRTVAFLAAAPAPRVTRASRMPIYDRARARGVGDVGPFVALVNPSAGSASVVFDAPGIDLDEARPEALIDYLAANVFNGSGSQSFYKRIWGAALAYSGYFYESATRERMVIYSDRCSDLPQLLHFMDRDVRQTREDPRYIDQAVSTAFGSHLSYEFEMRAALMADSLADGITPERVRAFRQRLLDFRSRPGLAAEMHARAIPVMSAVLPSLSPTSPTPAGALYFAVAPDARLDDYENEMQHTLGSSMKLVRLWPRDFWDIPPSGR